MKPFAYYLSLYVEYLKGIGVSGKTVVLKRYYLKLFAAYLSERGRAVLDVVETDLVSFMRYLREAISCRTKKPYSIHTVARASMVVKEFYRFLHRSEVVLYNPFQDFSFDLRIEERKKDIFTVDEMCRFLDSIETGTPDGLMDRAMFELMYSSGLRSGEVSVLQMRDMDCAGRMALIRQGKGKKDRYVPFSEAAARFLRRYITEARPARERCISERYKGYLFLTPYGNIRQSALRSRFLAILQKSGTMNKKLTLHSIRHSCATHLLEAGADVRYVQELLGHEQIQTTVQYTHLMIDNLKRIYKTYHPRENNLYEEVDEQYLADIEALKEVVRKHRERYQRAALRREAGKNVFS